MHACDLSELRARTFDLNNLQTRNRDLESKLEGVTFALNPDESHLVRVALELIVRELPIRLGRRDASVRPEMLLRAV